MRKNAFFHIVICAISLAIFFILKWIVRNWEAETVVACVRQTAIFMDKYEFYVEIAIVTTLITIVGIIARLCIHYQKGSMAIASGMFLFRPNSTEREIKRSENFLRKESLGCGFLYIRGATGWETFSSPGSPLYEAAKSCREVRIILIYPLSDAVLERARHLSVNIQDY